MELVPIHKRVIGLDVHQAQITACAILEEADGETRIEQHQLEAFKKDRRALAAWAAALDPDEVVRKYRHLLEEPVCGAGGNGHSGDGGQCPPRQAGA